MWHSFKQQLNIALAVGGPVDMAAQLAFWNLLALFPFAATALTLCAFLPLHGLDAQLLQFAHQLMPVEAATLFDSTVREVVGRQHRGLLLLSVVFAVWTASGGVSAAIVALDRARQVKETRSYWRRKLLSIGVTVAATLLLVVALVAFLVTPKVGHPLWSAFGLGGAFDRAWAYSRWPLLLMAMLATVSFSYWLLPAGKHRFHLFSPGSLAATASWILLSLGFRLYASRLAHYAAVYGTLAGAVALVMWLYLSGLAVILGSQLDAALERRHRRGAT